MVLAHVDKRHMVSAVHAPAVLDIGRQPNMSAKSMKKDRTAAKRKAELKALALLSDEAINTTDIPEVINWHGALRGKFYRPVKKPISIRVDADVRGDQ